MVGLHLSHSLEGVSQLNIIVVRYEPGSWRLNFDVFLTMYINRYTIRAMTKRRKEQPMEPHLIRFQPSLWAQAKQKAGLTPLSAIIRRLVELWVNGKIDLNLN